MQEVGQLAVLIRAALAQIAGDVSDTSRDHPSAVLKPTTRTGFALTAFQQIVNDTFEFGVCNVRLRPSASEPAEVVEYEVRVSINARND